MSDLNVVPTSTEASTAPVSITGTSKFEFGKDSFGVIRRTTGLASLASRVVKTFFTRKGSNPMNQAEGTFLPEMVGSYTGDKVAVALEVTRAIVDVENYFNSVQAKLNSYPASEMLESIVLDSVDFETQDSVKISIIIKALSGDQALLLLRT